MLLENQAISSQISNLLITLWGIFFFFVLITNI